MINKLEGKRFVLCIDYRIFLRCGNEFRGGVMDYPPDLWGFRDLSVFFAEKDFLAHSHSDEGQGHGERVTMTRTEARLGSRRKHSVMPCQAANSLSMILQGGRAVFSSNSGNRTDATISKRSMRNCSSSEGLRTVAKPSCSSHSCSSVLYPSAEKPSWTRRYFFPQLFNHARACLLRLRRATSFLFKASASKRSGYSSRHDAL